MNVNRMFKLDVKNDVTKFIIRLIFSLIYIASAVLKILDFEYFKYTLTSYNILPSNIIAILSFLIITVELVLGIMILFNISYECAVLGGIILMILFVMFDLWSIIYSKDWVCSCFGSIFNTKITYLTLFRNIVFCITGIAALFNPTKYLSFDEFSNKQISLVVFISILLGVFGFIYNDSKYKIINVEAGIRMELFNFKDLNNYYVDLINREQSYLVIFAFSLKDCPKCLLEAHFWNKISKEYGDKIKVIGIADCTEKHLLRLFVEHKRINFPVCYDSSGSFSAKYKYDSPVRIILDKDNYVIHYGRSEGGLDFQNKFMQQIQEAIINKK